MATPTYPSEAKIKELADQFSSYMLTSVKEGGKLMGGKDMMDFASASLPEGDTYDLTGRKVPAFVQALARGAKAGSNFFDVPLDPNIDPGPTGFAIGPLARTVKYPRGFSKAAPHQQVPGQVEDFPQAQEDWGDLGNWTEWIKSEHPLPGSAEADALGGMPGQAPGQRRVMESTQDAGGVTGGAAIYEPDPTNLDIPTWLRRRRGQRSAQSLQQEMDALSRPSQAELSRIYNGISSADPSTVTRDAQGVFHEVPATQRETQSSQNPFPQAPHGWDSTGDLLTPAQPRNSTGTSSSSFSSSALPQRANAEMLGIAVRDLQRITDTPARRQSIESTVTATNQRIINISNHVEALSSEIANSRRGRSRAQIEQEIADYRDQIGTLNNFLSELDGIW